MFNNTQITTKTNINTPVAGMLQKSHIKSFIIRCHSKSPMADKLFSMFPTFNGSNVIILQIVLMNKEELLLELVKTSDYE